MREIKYRVWNKVKNEMEESAYSKLLIQPSGSVCILQDDNTLADVSHDYELMQFTGLYDKNGKEIYEGDICLFKTKPYKTKTQNFNIEVVWFVDRWVGKIPHAKIINYMSLWGETLEIIGNVYQHPELLK